MRQFLEYISPYPIFSQFNENLKDGLYFKCPNVCKKNFNRNKCRNFYFELPSGKEIQHFECPSGFSILVFEYKFFRIIFSGLIIAQLNKSASRELKNKYSKNKINELDIKEYLENCKKLADNSEASIEH